MNMTYKGTGVNYDAMDPFKRQAQVAEKVPTSSSLFCFNLKSICLKVL
jgi:hypothetical protein